MSTRLSDVVNDACGKFVQRFGVDAFNFIREPENVPLRLRGIFCQSHSRMAARRRDLCSIECEKRMMRKVILFRSCADKSLIPNGLSLKI